MSATPCLEARNNKTSIENHLPENLNGWNAKTQDFQHFFLNLQLIWKHITWNHDVARIVKIIYYFYRWFLS